MIAFVIDRWQKSPLKRKIIFILAVITVLAVIVGGSVWLTAIQTTHNKNTFENEIIKQIVSGSVSSVTYTDTHGNLIVTVNFKTSSDQKTINNSIFSDVCMAVRNNVVKGSQFKDVKDITIDCMQDNKRIASISGFRETKDQFGNPTSEAAFSSFSMEGTDIKFMITECF